MDQSYSRTSNVAGRLSWFVEVSAEMLFSLSRNEPTSLWDQWFLALDSLPIPGELHAAAQSIDGLVHLPNATPGHVRRELAVHVRAVTRFLRKM